MGNSPLLRVHTPAQKLPQEADFPDLTAFPFNDLGNARRLEAAFGDDLCFVQAWKKWLVWDGTRWAPDETGEVHRRMMSLSRELQRQAAILEDESRRTAVTNWSLKLGNIVSIDNALKVAGKLRGIATQPCELDSDPYLLGVENGTVDLRTGQFRDSKRGDLITKCAGARYEPSAACPIWESFLETITEGDEDLARFLRQAVGYSLTALTSEQCLLFCYGLGRNGKSTFIETIAALAGDYAQGAPESLFAKSFRGNEQTHDVASLCGSRFAYGTELEEGTAMAESKIKRLTGGDSITARHLYGHNFTFNPSHTLWVSGNHKPRVKGTDIGIWRRIRLVPFSVQIPDEDVDPTLPTQLLGELSGILMWAIEGCLDWQEHGLIVPEVVKAATENYRSEEDLFGQFLKNCTAASSGGSVPKSVLYESYTTWCTEEGIKHPLTKPKVGSKMKERGFAEPRSNGVRSWGDLEMKDDE